MSNLDKYHEALKKQDQNITFYLRHRVRLLQLLSDLKTGKLSNLDSINETLSNLEKRKLALGQHIVDLDMDYTQILKNNMEESEKDAATEQLEVLQKNISTLSTKIERINRFKSDLNILDKTINSEFQADSIQISKTKIEELFKLEDAEEYQLIFRKGDLVNSKSQTYKFNKIDFHKNLKELTDALKKEKQSCDDLKTKIEKDRIQWSTKQKKFVQLYTSD